MEISGQVNPPKRVSFPSALKSIEEKDLGESARLLEHQALSAFPRIPSEDGSGSPVEQQQQPVEHSMVPPTPQVLTAITLPHNFTKAPLNVDEWPDEPLRIPCTKCGHYVETTLNEETEYMGCKPCFTGKPVFRRSFVHYCPNCQEPIGFHYTGEDCFCDCNKSTMSCDSVLTAACCAWGCCE